ncbi:MAG: protein-L-isoaspartate O-methyltransferase [Maricaulaceae bacterium]|jgi:protein-L-isoaspartate(D-aspartate) O-methyltransferase
MIDYAVARKAMIDGQVRINDVTDGALLDAMSATPRELFAPKAKRTLAYGDLDLAVGEGRWLMRPRDFAKLVEALEIEPTDVVLDIACARGYSSAVLSRLAETVVGLETDQATIIKANEALSAADAANVAVVLGDLKAGLPDQGPFDVIFVNGAVSKPPQTWLDQLSDGGRLGVVVAGEAIGRATVFTRAGGAVGSRVVFDCATPLLPGFERPAAFTLG